MAFVTDAQFLQHVDIVREEFKNRQILLHGVGVPNLPAPVGAFYLDMSTNDRYEKIDVDDVDWQLYTSENAQGAWQLHSGNVTAERDWKLMVNTTVSPITVTLPISAVPGDVIWFADYLSTFSTNNLILDRNGHKIMSETSNFTVNASGVLFMIMYINVNVGWKIFSFSD